MRAFNLRIESEAFRRGDEEATFQGYVNQTKSLNDYDNESIWKENLMFTKDYWSCVRMQPVEKHQIENFINTFARYARLQVVVVILQLFSGGPATPGSFLVEVGEDSFLQRIWASVGGSLSMRKTFVAQSQANSFLFSSSSLEVGLGARSARGSFSV